MRWEEDAMGDKITGELGVRMRGQTVRRWRKHGLRGESTDSGLRFEWVEGGKDEGETVRRRRRRIPVSNRRPDARLASCTATPQTKVRKAAELDPSLDNGGAAQTPCGPCRARSLSGRSRSPPLQLPPPWAACTQSSASACPSTLTTPS